MGNKNVQEDVLEDLPEIAEGDEDNTDWKALAKDRHGLAKRYQTKLKKAKEKAEAKPKIKKAKADKTKDTDSFNDGQKALLVANGIKGKDEHQLAFDIMKRLGTDDLDLVIEDEFFMSKIKKMREVKEKDDATPPSSGRSPSSSPKDSVDHYIAKGEMPPKDQPKLRQEYVNAKMKAQSDGNPFTDNPVVGGILKPK